MKIIHQPTASMATAKTISSVLLLTSGAVNSTKKIKQLQPNWAIQFLYCQLTLFSLHECMASECGEKITGNKLKLYSFWRSSCSFRVRIALNLKGLKYEYKAVNLWKGEQQDPEFLKINPLGFVPVLIDGDTVIGDSFAIIMYLDEKYPQYSLLPHDIKKRAINFQAAHIVCSSIQPGQKMSQLTYIEEKVGPDEKDLWVKSIIGKGFTALEKLLKDHAGKYATGDDFFLADLFLAPQIFSAITKFNIDLTDFPTLARLNEAYIKIPAFQDALPENQPDAPSQARLSKLQQRQLPAGFTSG